MITLFSISARRALRRHVGEGGIFNPVRTYLDAPQRPQLTLYHGERCRPDTEIAEQIAVAPEVQRTPLPTGRHILWVPIARQGSIQQLIMGELESPDSEA